MDPARTGPRTRPAARKRRLDRRARRALLATVALCMLLAGAWMWFRDSPLVAVQQVTVSGQSGADAGQISAALESAARTMSTLDVQLGRLRRAVAPYPVVKDIRVTTQFPHGMHIEVIEHVAVGAIDAGGQKVAVAPDGTVMHDVAVSPLLPTISVSVAPTGTRVTSGPAAAAIKLLSAAPAQLLAKISQVTTVAPHGLVAQIRGGPSVYFGDDTQLEQKWIAASEVLGDPGSAGAVYIDVTDPQRPAAGAGTDGQSTADSATGSASSTSSATGAAASGTTSAGTSTDGTSATGVASTATTGG
ncbi:MAG TPA: FtsQ-type POTRA domain-containing protein [Solirubrobacteraceae bacterium]|nr:FtsQ-type POTRA domain-containing protein [Solirubrobacteraceae bacterium]